MQQNAQSRPDIAHDFQKAIDYLENEVNLEENVNSRFLLGAAYGKLEKFPEAVDNLKKYLALASSQDPRRQRAETTLKFYESQIK